MFCPNCGKEIPNVSKFCPHCGKAISVPITPIGGVPHDKIAPNVVQYPSPGRANERPNNAAANPNPQNTYTHGKIQSTLPDKGPESAHQKQKNNLIVYGIIGILIIIGVFLVTRNFGSKLSGTYVSETRPNACSVVFDKDGSLLYYYHGTTLYGTYSKVNGNWVLRIEGSGLYFDNVFVAQRKGLNKLAIADKIDDPDAEIFVKQW